MSQQDEQAMRLEQYFDALTADPAAAPPPDLDPATAKLVLQLRQEVLPELPSTTFRQHLAQRLAVAPEASPPPLGSMKGKQMPTATTITPPIMRGTWPRAFTAIVIVALLVGSVFVARDLVQRANSTITNPAYTSTQTPAPCVDTLGAWRDVATLPTFGGATVTDDKYIYVAGGTSAISKLNSSSQMLRYDPATNSWTQLATSATAYSAASAAYSPISKKIYVFGGMSGPDEATGTVLADTRIYDTVSNSWSSGAAMPDVRTLMAAAYWNGKIYVVGGIASFTAAKVGDNTWEYDPAANKWTSRATRPAGSGFGYGVINGHLYTGGGYSPASNGFTSSFYDYDIAADKWTPRASLPKAIDYAASAVVGQRLYLFGGLGGSREASQKQSYVYDPASDTWSSGPDLQRLRSFAGGISIGNTIYAVGGSNASGELTSVEAATVTCEAAAAPPAATPPPQTASTDNPRLFSETGKTVGGKFRAYWEAHGGLEQQGYPISNEFQEVSPLDGKTYTVQYFERAVFELHPENAAPNDVLLSQLGTFRYKAKYPSGAASQQVSTTNPRQFSETGHSIGGKFRAYWEAHGGLAQQGYPISDEFQEVSELDGKTYTVQYFERAVFELHPENAGTAYEVQLSQLGTFTYKAKYGTPLGQPRHLLHASKSPQQGFEREGCNRFPLSDGRMPCAPTIINRPCAATPVAQGQFPAR